MHQSRALAFVIASIVAVSSIAGAQAPAKVGRGELLRGITLTAAEKGKLKEIQTKYRAENKDRQALLKKSMAEARAARQKGDTAAARKIVEGTRGEREQLRVSLEKQRSELRSALSPEHQKQFDANVKVIAERRGGVKDGKHGARKHKRGTENHARSESPNT